MKRTVMLMLTFCTIALVSAQSPQKLSYQAVIRNTAGKLVQNGNVGVKISILQGFVTGTEVYSETHATTTNANGLVTLEIGGGSTTGSFSGINWANGPYFLKTETDPAGGTNYSISAVSQLLSVPYALYAEKANVDGSETKVKGGSNIRVSGNGTASAPYIITSGYQKVTINNTQLWTVPGNVTKIKVELWGGAGGGGGAGCYSFTMNKLASTIPSYSFPPIDGGYGGSGGFATQEIDVTPNQEFYVIIGSGGIAGTNATWNPSGNWEGDLSGENGGISWFGTIKAAGGQGGFKGSFINETLHGAPGTDNLGDITAYSGEPKSNILDVFTGLSRSYISDRVVTSKPGKGGRITSLLPPIVPVSGEAGCAIITLIE